MGTGTILEVYGGGNEWRGEEESAGLNRGNDLHPLLTAAEKMKETTIH